MKPVPSHPAVLPFTKTEQLSSEAQIYLSKLEAALKELQDKVTVLEGYHP